MSSSFRSKPRARGGADQSGFTLLEVLISMAVLIFLSLGIYQATTETYRLRDVLQNEGEFYNSIRMAMDIFQRDVALIYNPALMAPPKQQPQGSGQPQQFPGGQPPASDLAPQQPDREMQDILATDLGQTTPYWEPALDKTGIRPSRFVGTDTKMTFVSVSNIRIYRDAPESEFAKISYSIERDATPPTDFTTNEVGSMLVKWESTDAFDDDSKREAQFSHKYPLLHGISALKFEYCQIDKDPNRSQKCFTNWDSDTPDFKNLYPDLIKVTMTVKGRSRLMFEGTYIFRPEVPLRGLNPST